MPSYRLISCLTLALTLAGAGITARAQTTPLPNGDVEECACDPADYFLKLYGGSREITGWLINRRIDYIGTYFDAASGERSIDMNGDDPGEIVYAMATSPGKDYQLVFDFAGNPDCPREPTKVLEVSAAGVSEIYEMSTVGRSGSDMGWEERSFTFVATGLQTDITFASRSPGQCGPMIDNLRLAGACVRVPVDTRTAITSCANQPLTLRPTAPGAYDFLRDGQLLCAACDSLPLPRAAPGQYLLRAAGECPRTDTIDVAVGGTDGPTFATLASCRGAVTLPDGRTVTTSLRDTAVVAGLGGCDSTVITDVIVGTDARTPFHVSFCAGDTVEVLGRSYTGPGDFERDVQAGNCTRTVALSLKQLPRYDLAATLPACDGEPGVVDGQAFSAGEVYVQALATVRGCDSVTTISFAADESRVAETSATICEGDAYDFRGRTYDIAGAYDDIVAQVDACDSVYRLRLAIIPTAQTTLAYEGCTSEPLVVEGVTVRSDSTWVTTYEAISGCDSLHASVVSFRALPKPVAVDVQDACNGEAVGAVTLSPGEHPVAEVTWGGGVRGLRRDGLPPATYAYVVTDDIGCVYEGDVEVSAVRSVDVSAALEPPTCRGDADGRLALAPTDSLRSSAMQMATDLGHAYDSLRAGLSTVTYVDVHGCPGQLDTVMPEGHPLPLIEHESPISLTLGEYVTLAPVYNAADTVRWRSSDFAVPADSVAPTVRPVVDGTALAMAVDAVGCRDSVEVAFLLFDGPGLYLPTAFSPNGDGVNDRWRPLGGAEVGVVRKLWIFDRWGEWVFRQADLTLDDPRLGWDGRYRDQVMDPAVFAFVVEYELIDGRVVQRVGDLTLVR